jgi:2-polyprenyl-3-methyl-5-hydroxy-6-metoxy-1,4-benzoquinol methylase
LKAHPDLPVGSADGGNSLNQLVERIRDTEPVFWKSVKRTIEQDSELFRDIGSLMTRWAANYLGDGWIERLLEGYKNYVMEANRSQLEYETSNRYRNMDYEAVKETTYANAEFMDLYHWGVYLTPLLWAHHLDLFRLYRNFFLPRLSSEGGRVLDLGSGSGIWGLMHMAHTAGWSYTGIDISERSLEMAREMAIGNQEDQISFEEGDALTYKTNEPYDAGYSCYLLEHLEVPHVLLENLSANLRPGAYAFVIGALTAAEVDHIFEFRRESELIDLAEDAGFRVLSTCSGAPATYPERFRLLPRSMAMVLQKKRHELW